MGLAHGQGNGFTKYPTVIDSLAAQNYTQSRLFSLDLGGQVPPGSEFFRVLLDLTTKTTTTISTARAHHAWVDAYCRFGTDADLLEVATTGQMVFGGVDRNKYSGRLGKVPTNPSDP